MTTDNNVADFAASPLQDEGLEAGPVSIVYVTATRKYRK
jgi:hypothetical protein